MAERFRRTWLNRGHTPEGWPGFSDECPPWTPTIVATWRPPTIDWGRFAATLTLLGLFVVLAVFLWRDSGGFGFLLPVAFVVFLAWDAVRQLRARQPAASMTLVLEPDALRLSSSDPAFQDTRLPRDRANWLAASEIEANWQVRYLWLVDEADKEVAQFIGSLADVHIREPGVPSGITMPAQVPVAVLLGDWWPHPARRMSVRGSAQLRFPWREPGLEGVVRHEHRQRAIWSLFYGAFALGCFWVAIDGAGPVWMRAIFGLVGLGLAIWRVRVLMRRPRFLGVA